MGILHGPWAAFAGIVISTLLSAQQPRIAFERVDLPPSLRGARVLSLLARPDGTLWVGTSRGLHLCQGVEGEDRRPSWGRLQELPSARVHCLVEDSRGRIWLGGNGGLQRFDPEAGRIALESVDLGSSNPGVVLSALRTQDDHLWFGSTTGLLHWDPHSDVLESISKSVEEMESSILGIAESTEGWLWLVTTSDGLVRFDRTERRFAPMSQEGHGEDLGRVWCVHRTSDDLLFCGALVGLYLHDPLSNTFHRHTDDPALAKSSPFEAHSIHSDRDDNLWVGGAGGKVELYARGSKRPSVHHVTRPSLVQDAVHVITEDATGAVWFGANSGLYRCRFDPDHFAIYDFEQKGEEVPRNLTSVATDPEGNAWIATLEDGLWCMDHLGRRIRRVASDSLPDRLTTSTFDSGGRLWMGTRHAGLIRWRPDLEDSQALPVDPGDDRALPDSTVRVVHEGPFGNLWVGTRDGICVVDPETSSVIQRIRCEGVDRLRVDQGAVARDRSGYVWMGLQNGGLIRLDPRTFDARHLTPGIEAGLPRRATALCASGEGSLWIGTQKGELLRLDVDRGGASSGLVETESWETAILGLHEDEYGFLWIFQSNGVSRLDTRTKERLSCESVLPARYLTPIRGSLHVDPQGVLHLGGWSGYLRIDPRGMREYFQPPRLSVHGFLLQEETGRSRYLPPHEEALRLPFDQNSLGFELALLGDPGALGAVIRYRLRGLDDTWYEAPRSRVLTFPSLAPGSYALELRGRSGAGVRTIGTTRFRFEITPPFWRTGKFVGGTFVAVILACGALAYAWRRLRRSHHFEIDRLEEQMQRAQKLESLGVLAGGIAHDFNNLLTVITGNASLAAGSVEEGSEAALCLREIESVARKATDLTRQMLNFAGSPSMRRELLSVTDCVREMEGLLRSSVSKKARLVLDLEENLPLVEGDPGQLHQVVLNLVRNASEALGEREGNVRVAVSSQEIGRKFLGECFHAIERGVGKFVVLRVTDDGCGIEEEDVHRVFEPFFTTKFSGRGLGLASVMGIVRRHQGTLHVRSHPGRGTTMTVLLPTHAGVRVDAKSPQPSSGGLVSLAGCHVLVVDDEESVRRVSRLVLENNGARTWGAEDGWSALELLEGLEEPIHVVLLDMTMPRLNGLETLERLTPLYTELGVVLYSGFSEESIGAACRDPRVTYLSKPFGNEELLRAVWNAWRAKRET